MDALPLWISQHALALWAAVLILALLVGDSGWRRARRRRLAATGKDGYLALRPGTAAILQAAFAALFLLLAWGVWTRTALVGFDAALPRPTCPPPRLRPRSRSRKRACSIRSGAG